MRTPEPTSPKHALQRTTSRAWQPAITFLVEAELDPAVPPLNDNLMNPLVKFIAQLLTALFATASPVCAQPKPDIVLILTDDQGYADLGSYGAGKIKTPNLDKMATEGLKLTSFYAHAVCGPSRAALMTGCYPIRVAEPGNQKNQHTILHAKEITIAEVLRGAGYVTGCIGKWHLGAPAKSSPSGFDPATMPNGQGFDEFYGTPLYNGYTVKVADTKFRSPILRNEETVVPAVDSWDNITQDYTREALDFIRRHREKPFFLYLAHNMPHIPLGASAKFKGKSDGGPYGDAVEEIDWSCGEIFKTLRELGLAENTLVILGQRPVDRDHSWHETRRQTFHPARPLRKRRSPPWLQDGHLGRRPARALHRLVAGEDPRRFGERRDHCHHRLSPDRRFTRRCHPARRPHFGWTRSFQDVA